MADLCIASNVPFGLPAHEPLRTTSIGARLGSSSRVGSSRRPSGLDSSRRPCPFAHCTLLSRRLLISTLTNTRTCAMSCRFDPSHPHRCWLLAVCGYDTSRLQRHTLRPRATSCQHCHALMWLEEHIKRSTLDEPRFGRCCNHGKVLLDPVKGTPRPCANLLLKVSDGSASFVQLIRKYNSGTSMTSLGVNVDSCVTYSPGMVPLAPCLTLLCMTRTCFALHRTPDFPHFGRGGALDGSFGPSCTNALW